MRTAKSTGSAAGIGSVIALLFIQAGVATPALATLTASMVTNFPATVSVGDTFPASLIITNTATGGGVPDCVTSPGDACQDEIVSNIKFVPSCAVLTGGGDACQTPDPNTVFTISSVVAGPAVPNNACSSMTFSPTLSGGVISLNPSADPVISGAFAFGFSAFCRIDFTVHVNTVPASDAKADAGIQTFQVVTADLEGDEDHNTAKANGVAFTTFNVPLPVFVIGDVEPHAVGDTVNYWGSQWWKNNFMSGFVSNGVASFKGYADESTTCGGTWDSLPGNSSKPPQSIGSEVIVIVTDTVHKDGPNISGTIKQMWVVEGDPHYGPAPGHDASGRILSVVCP